MAVKLTSRAETLHPLFCFLKLFWGPQIPGKANAVDSLFGGSRRAQGSCPGRGSTSRGRHQGGTSPWLCVNNCTPHDPLGVAPSMLCCCSTDLGNTEHVQPPGRALSLQNQISLLPGPAFNFHWELQAATCVGHQCVKGHWCWLTLPSKIWGKQITPPQDLGRETCSLKKPVSCPDLHGSKPKEHPQIKKHVFYVQSAPPGLKRIQL